MTSCCTLKWYFIKTTSNHSYTFCLTIVVANQLHVATKQGHHEALQKKVKKGNNIVGYATTKECYNERMLQRTQTLQRTQMLQRTQSNLDSFFKKMDTRPSSDEHPTGQSPKMSRNDDSSSSISMWCFKFSLGKVFWPVYVLWLGYPLQSRDLVS